MALNPATPVETLRELVPLVSMILVMTVEPGFGGQRFIETSLDKIRRVRDLAPDLDIEVDGGIDVHTAPLAAAACTRWFGVWKPAIRWSLRGPSSSMRKPV